MPNPEQLARLQAVVPFAQAAQIKWDVPASVSLAQWTFESGWGADQIAIEARNCFGIKHVQSDRSQPYMEFKTPEYAPGAALPHYILDDFVKYPTIEACFQDHGRLIATASRYQPAMAVADDPHAFASQLRLCGYSTTPTYGSMLCGQIDRLRLTQYDYTLPRFAPDPPAKRTTE